MAGVAEITAIAGAVAGIGTALAAAVKFVWGKVEARFSRIESALDECREERALSEKRRGVLVTIIELLKQELRHHLPDSPMLRRADSLMTEYRAYAARQNDE